MLRKNIQGLSKSFKSHRVITNERPLLDTGANKVPNRIGLCPKPRLLPLRREEKSAGERIYE
jgi:hypothetical protein